MYKQQKGIIKKNRYSSIGRFKIEIDTNFLLNPQISYFVKNISQIIKKIDPKQKFYSSIVSKIKYSNNRSEYCDIK